MGVWIGMKRMCAGAAVVAATAQGIPASRECTDFELPGTCGETVCLKQVGTPFSHTWTYDGKFSLCPRKDAATSERYYVFGEEDDDLGVVCTETRLNCTQRTPASYDAGRPGSDVEDKPPPMPKPIVSEEELAEDNADSLFAQMSTAGDTDERRRRLASVEEMHNMVLLVRFSDHKNANLPSAADFDVLFNNNGPDDDLCPTGSVADYFDSNFYGKIKIKSTIVGWVDIDMTESEAAGDADASCNGLCSSAQFRSGISQALAKAETDLGIVFKDFDYDDDGKIDIFTVIHSGHGAEAGGSQSSDRIWSHKWRLSPSYYSEDDVKVSNYAANPGRWGSSGSEISRIGVISHEMTHFFGVPDLYDTTEATRGIGRYGLMSDAWGVDNTQRYPPSMMAWTKEQLGVVDPVVISAAGTYSVPAIQDGADNAVYRINYYDASGSKQKDYLLIENRQDKGFDVLLKGGLLISHVDSKMTTNAFASYPGLSTWPTYHYMVAIIQADGDYDLETDVNSGDAGDWWRSGRDALTDASTPSLNSYYLIADGICSGHILYDFSASADTMTFKYATTSQDCDNQSYVLASSSTPKPTPLPTSAPTPRPTLRPTKRPTGPPAPVTPTQFPTAEPTVDLDNTPYPTRAPTPYPTRNWSDEDKDPYDTSATGSGTSEDDSSEGSGGDMMIIIIGGVGGAGVLALVVAGFAFYRRRKALNKKKNPFGGNGGPKNGGRGVTDLGFAATPDIDDMYGGAGATGMPPNLGGRPYAAASNPRLANLQGQSSFHHTPPSPFSSNPRLKNQTSFHHAAV